MYFTLEVYTKLFMDSKYFSQIGGGGFDTGLSELVAETNMLLTTYGNDSDTIKTRASHLVKYFPRTIAKAAELLGYNNIS